VDEPVRMPDLGQVAVASLISSSVAGGSRSSTR
jgi:hypothetical protein